MITLNLNTPQDKKKVARHRLTLLTKDITLSLLFLSLLLSSILLSCYLILTKNFIEITQGTISSFKSGDVISQEVGQINEDLKKIEEIQEKYIDWLKVLLTLNNLIPQKDIQVTNLEINHSQKTILLHGKALTRDQFLVLKQNLEDSGLFEKIESPLSNLLLAENLNFKLEMHYQPKDLPKAELSNL